MKEPCLALTLAELHVCPRTGTRWHSHPPPSPALGDVSFGIGCWGQDVSTWLRQDPVGSPQ